MAIDVVAPMPGTIAEILVDVGDSVNADDELIILEAMKMDPPYLMWREFDKDLANDFSKFITGNLYSRTVLTLPERQMVACAILAALRATGELKLHVNAALNVGCDPKKLAEIFFQVATYAGMPAVNEALEIYRDVLKERGEWPLK